MGFRPVDDGVARGEVRRRPDVAAVCRIIAATGTATDGDVLDIEDGVGGPVRKGLFQSRPVGDKDLAVDIVTGKVEVDAESLVDAAVVGGTDISGDGYWPGGGVEERASRSRWKTVEDCLLFEVWQDRKE